MCYISVFGEARDEPTEWHMLRPTMFSLLHDTMSVREVGKRQVAIVLLSDDCFPMRRKAPNYAVNS